MEDLGNCSCVFLSCIVGRIVDKTLLIAIVVLKPKIKKRSAVFRPATGNKLVYFVALYETGMLAQVQCTSLECRAEL